MQSPSIATQLGISYVKASGKMAAYPAIRDQLTADTRYVVFDLDGTVFRNINIGERLGWEIIATLSYGDEVLRQYDRKRTDSRFLFCPRFPFRTLRYLFLGAKLWAYPGLFYLIFGKILGRLPFAQTWLRKKFGPHPITKIQDVTRIALWHHMSQLPLSSLEVMVERLWHRFSKEQVITGSLIEALRQEFPKIRFLLSSASPQPVLDLARKKLRADAAFGSVIPSHLGFVASPYDVRWLYGCSLPRLIAEPSSIWMNCSGNKIRLIQHIFPDFADPLVEKVGVTDNKHHEDENWVDHFNKLIQINSPDGFQRLPKKDSPLREVFQAELYPDGDLQGDDPEKSKIGTESLENHVPSFIDLIPSLEETKELNLELRPWLDSQESIDLSHLICSFNTGSDDDRIKILPKIRRQLQRYFAVERKGLLNLSEDTVF